jgi:hypothetical protein
MPSGEHFACWLPRQQTRLVRMVLVIGLAIVLAVLILSTAIYSRTMLNLGQKRNRSSFTTIEQNGDLRDLGHRRLAVSNGRAWS